MIQPYILVFKRHFNFVDRHDGAGLCYTGCAYSYEAIDLNDYSETNQKIIDYLKQLQDSCIFEVVNATFVPLSFQEVINGKVPRVHIASTKRVCPTHNEYTAYKFVYDSHMKPATKFEWLKQEVVNDEGRHDELRLSAAFQA